MPNNSLTPSPTPAGPTISEADKAAVAGAINQMFAQFKLAYYHQFVKAFPDEGALALARQLWFSHLKHCAPETILAATHRALRESDYLPTVHSILRHCEAIAHSDLPAAWLAYREACNAPEPKAAHAWSHPLVYHTGRAVGWYFLANTAESRAFPIFERCYRDLCQRLQQGETFPAPTPPALPAPDRQPLDREQSLRRLRETRALLRGGNQS